MSSPPSKLRGNARTTHAAQCDNRLGADGPAQIRLGERPSRPPHDRAVLVGRRGRRHRHDGVVAVGRDDSAGVAKETLRILSFLDGPDAPSRLLTEHDDTAIRGAKVLEPVDGHRALPDLRLVVARASLTGLVGIGGGQLARQHDAAVGHHAGVAPAVSLTWRNSMNIVRVLSWGTIQRLIMGPLNGCSRWPSSQIGATCCRLGMTSSTIRAQTLSPTRRVAT